MLRGRAGAGDHELHVAAQQRHRGRKPGEGTCMAMFCGSPARWNSVIVAR
jgi:hypothetical protein